MLRSVIVQATALPVSLPPCDLHVLLVFMPRSGDRHDVPQQLDRAKVGRRRRSLGRLVADARCNAATPNSQVHYCARPGKR
jgi:hypothetical protein